MGWLMGVKEALLTSISFLSLIWRQGLLDGFENEASTPAYEDTAFALYGSFSAPEPQTASDTGLGPLPQSCIVIIIIIIFFSPFSSI